MSFAEGAARLAGLAGALIGWRPGEFWSATPTELMSIFTVLAGQGGDGAAGPPDPATMARLKEMWPDG